MGITAKMRDGTYYITDRMVGVDWETTEGLCHRRKGGYTWKELFNVGYNRNDRHPAKWAAFTVEPRCEILLRKKLFLPVLCDFSATAVVSSISLHNLKLSTESTYRGVMEVPPLSTRGVDDPGELVLDKRKYNKFIIKGTKRSCLP